MQGVNIMAFCKEYNAQTAKLAGQVIPVEITVYEVGFIGSHTDPHSFPDLTSSSEQHGFSLWLFRSSV